MRALSVAERKIAERFGVDLGRVQISRPRPFVDGTASASCSGRVRSTKQEERLGNNTLRAEA